MKERICLYEGCQCGDGGTRNIFIPKGNHNTTKYCCPKCYADDRRGKPLDPVMLKNRKKRSYRRTVKYGDCLYCGKEFQVTHKHQKFCSVLHSSRYNGQQRVEQAKKPRKSSSMIRPIKQITVAV